MPQTLLDKIWDQHVIAQLGSGLDLLHIDRTLVHDLGGAREVVIPGETGFLLPRDSVRELVDAIGALVADPALRDRLGATGRERFTDQFRHQTMTRRIRKVYDEVLKS